MANAKTVSVDPDVLAALKAELKEELRAEQGATFEPVVTAESPFKTEGGAKLESHDAVRQDF
jgi:hypothetical protein